MCTPAEDAALSAFIDAVASDADPGYPNGAAFIPWQATPQTHGILWRYLREGRPAILVGTSGVDTLIEPARLGRFARLRNQVFQRITVKISSRRRGTLAAPDIPAIRAEIRRHHF